MGHSALILKLVNYLVIEKKSNNYIILYVIMVRNNVISESFCTIFFLISSVLDGNLEIKVFLFQ